MPASEETYYRTRSLHIAFAITSLAMAATIVWMIVADHNRPWKTIQRDFQQIETQKLSAQQQEALRAQQAEHKARLDELKRRREAVTRRAAENTRAIRDQQAEIDSNRGAFQQADTRKRFKKAEMDSLRSFYDGMIDRDEKREAARYLVDTIQPAEREFAKISQDYDKVVRRLSFSELKLGLLASNYVEVAELPPPGTPAAEAGFQVGDQMTVADFQALLSRAVDILMGKEPAGQVEIVVRRDGADKALAAPTSPVPSPGRPETTPDAWAAFGLKVTPITAEVVAKRIEDITRDADRIERTLLTKQQQYGEGSGVGGFINRTAAWMRGLPLLDLAAPPVKIQQITLPELKIDYNFKEVPRFDRCTTCHLGIDHIGFDVMADGKTPMPPVYHSHPFLTSGATYLDPKGQEKPAGLFLDSNGPHPINAFGCTICHGGQGSGTSFTYASHTPNTIQQQEEWVQEHDWESIHFWDFPMLPKRFTESSCLKCHYQITDLSEQQAPKLLAGYQRITRYGCTGCHTIGGDGSPGPDLTDNRQVGPNLKHVASKVSRDWMLKWIANPHAFRPDTRMPRFFGITNNDKPEDQPKSFAEIHAITHYLFQKSTEPEDFVDPPAQNDPARGKQLFLEKGCLACHSNRPYNQADLPSSLEATISDAYAIDPDKTYAPEVFPENVRQYAEADFGPNLSSMAAKFSSEQQGYRWLANWIRSPERYHPKSLMPNLQLSDQDAADIAAWILSAREDWSPEATAKFWPVEVEVPPVETPEVQKGLDELVSLYLGKAKMYNKRTILLSEVDSVVAQMKTEEKLSYVGERTISRLGCFGCHNISGFEDAKPIGTPLNGWGLKDPTRLDFAHIGEYLESQRLGEEGVRDGTSEFYQEKLEHHDRMGFLYQKIHRPRSYDYKKAREDILAWDERLRMPQFSWADDPEAVEEVMTFVLGLTGENIPAEYLPHYEAPKQALAQGERLLERYNCRGCHVLAMPKYTIAAGANLDRVFKGFDPSDPNPFKANVSLSYDNRSKDYLALFPGRDREYEPGKPPELGPPDTEPITIEGMPTLVETQEDDQGRTQKTIYVQVWRPVTIRGYTFNIGDTVLLDASRVQITPAEGGHFAWLYSAYQAEQSGEPMTAAWNKLPPPLLREGLKVQTPWLTNFLLDPNRIRPAAQLRMPRFHYGSTPAEVATEAAREGPRAETRDLANYLAARDGAVFPYQEIPQREQQYLADHEAIFDGSKDKSSSATESGASKYLAAGWDLITKNQCVQCHAIGQYQPTGEPETHGPDLRNVADRLRPDYILSWIAQPQRTLPYTAMPQVFLPHPPEGTPPLPGVPAELEGKPLEQARTARDTLLNFVTTIEQQLAKVAPPPEPSPAAAPAAGGEGQAPSSGGE